MTQAPRLYPILRFRDADAMIAWLTDVPGFALRAAYRNKAGQVQHAELTPGPSILMIGTWREADGKVAHRGVPPYVAVDDADRLHDAMVAGGAIITDGLHDTDYGSRDFSCADPEGNIWSFGTYRPSSAS